MTNKSRKIIKDSEERINKKRERIYKNKKK